MSFWYELGRRPPRSRLQTARAVGQIVSRLLRRHLLAGIRVRRPLGCWQRPDPHVTRGITNRQHGSGSASFVASCLARLVAVRQHRNEEAT
jgi:hypothetical protein